MACISTLPMAVASTGPVITVTSRAIGSELVEQAVLRPTADDVNRVKPFAAQFFQPLQHPAIFQRDAFQRHANDLAFCLRNSLVCVLAIFANAVRHIACMKEIIMVRVEHSQKWFCFRSQARDLIVT